jgi:hypothetical protein
VEQILSILRWSKGPVLLASAEEAVFIANQFAKATNIGHSCDEIIEEIPAEMMHDLKLGSGPSDRFFRFIETQLQLLCSYLNLDISGLVIIQYDRKQPILMWL